MPTTRHCINEFGADWSLNGLSTFTGASTLVNLGTIDVNGVSAISGLSSIANTGIVEVLTGSLTVDAGMTGAGTVSIYGTTMEFGAQSDAHVQFTTNLSGTLILDHASLFTGTVTGFSQGTSSTSRTSFRQVSRSAIPECFTLALTAAPLS